MQRGHGPRGKRLEERKVDEVDVEVQHVEVVGAAPHLVQHRQMRGDVGLERRRVESYGLLAHRHEERRRLGFRAREQRDVVSLIHQGIGEVGHDALGSTVKARRNRFGKRGDLRDAQRAAEDWRHRVENIAVRLH